jgi:Ca2+-binding EF-hand superfamily protein
MLKHKNLIWIVVVFAQLLATGALLRTADAQKVSPKAPGRLALGEAEVRQLLPLMDTDKNGRISKQEYMAFMEAEFERLDADKSGQLDTKELTQSSLRVSSFTKAGK